MLGSALLAAGLLGCANTALRIETQPGAKATLHLATGSTLVLTGPATLDFHCRTWGDSYFVVGGWTCSGGQLSEQGAHLAATVVEAAVRAALASTGAGAAGTAVGLVSQRFAPAP